VLAPSRTKATEDHLRILAVTRAAHGIANMRGAMPSAQITIDRAIDDFVGHIRRSVAPINPRA
jgi:uncharacterized membrane protein (DUF2068 family)